MGVNAGREEGFLDMMANLGVIKDAVITHADGTTTQARVLVQATNGFFEITTPIYEGDTVEFDDPRGGRERRVAGQVKLNETPGMSKLQHIAVKWGAAAPAGKVAQHVTYNGPVVNINGGNAQVAWGDKVTQTQTVAAGYQDVAQVVAEVLRRLPELGLDSGDFAFAQTSAEEILHEVTKSKPDDSLIKRGVTALKGALVGVALAPVTGVGAGIQDLARQLIEQLGSAIS